MMMFTFGFVVGALVGVVVLAAFAKRRLDQLSTLLAEVREDASKLLSRKD